MSRRSIGLCERLGDKLHFFTAYVRTQFAIHLCCRCTLHEVRCQKRRADGLKEGIGIWAAERQANSSGEPG